MLTALNRKLFRDLWRIRGQAFAIGLVMSAGVTMFVMSTSAMVSLEESKRSYYDRYRFAEIFAEVRRAPNGLVSRIEELPGVGLLDTRIVNDVLLNIETEPRPVTGRFISVPDQGEPTLNHLSLRRGRWLEPGRSDEALVSEAFAQAHHLQPGDAITAILNGRLRRIKLVGIVLSPEFIIQIPPGSLLPDDRQFGVFWMARSNLEALYDMKGAFNQLLLKPLRDSQDQQLIQQLDQLLEPYGTQGAYRRDRLASDQFITDEIRQLQATATVAPIIFLFVAAFLLNVIIARTIQLQREQIAVLKAFGYGGSTIGWHYFKMVLLITWMGIVLGVIGGVLMGYSLTQFYAHFYHFPAFDYRIEWWMVVAATLISCLAATLGTLFSLYRVSRLPPAEAMRPEPPSNYRISFLERLYLIQWMPQAGRMILRNLARNGLKAGLNTMGIALAIGSLILGGFSLDAIQEIIDFQFRDSQRQDVMVTLIEPTEQRVINDFNQLPGVLLNEPFRAVPVRIRHGHVDRQIALMGLSTDAKLFRILDDQRREISVPPSGLLLSQKLAEILHVPLGKSIEVEVLDRHRKKISIPVVATMGDYSGLNAYMNLDEMNRILVEGNLVSGVFLRLDPKRESDFYHRLKQTPRVAGLTIKTMAIESFEETIAENLLVIRGFNMLFASIIAFGVVFNATRISLAEQSRELATLRVIGFTRFEVASILLGELAVLTVVAMPIGCLLGYLFASLVIGGLDTELYRIPLIINVSTYAQALITVVVATVLSALMVIGKINKLDLVSVLKVHQ